MKKRIAMLMLVLAMAVMMFSGCGKSKNQAPVVGEWKMTTIEISGVTMDVDQFLSIAGQEDTKMNMTIKEDGTFFMDVVGEQAEGTWEYKEPKCTLTVDGDSIDAEYKDGKLVIDMDGNGTMTFEK